MHARSTVAALVVSSLVAATALPGLAAAEDRDHPRAAPAGEEKSGVVATGLAVGGTAAGFGMLVLSGHLENPYLAGAGTVTALVGPSAGHFYAGEHGHGVVTSSLRAAGAATFLVGFDMSFCLFECDKTTTEYKVGTALAFAGLGVYAATAAYDIYDAHRAAGRANRRRSTVTTASLLSTPDGRTAPGLVVAGQF